MTESNSQPEKPKTERRYDPELLKKGLRRDPDQCKMLKRCSDSKNTTEWNQWRLKNPREEIFLEGADFNSAYLEGVNFRSANLKEANFSLAHLENSYFHKALLQNATLKNAYLQNAVLWGADISGTSIENARVNSSTSFWKCKVNRYSPNVKFTDFSGVSLSSLIIEPSKKQRLEYNIRRKNWEKWYIYKDWQEECKKKRHIIIRLLMYFIRWFWLFSDYGRSTGRIAAWFFGFTVVFAGVYCLFALKSPPGIVSNLLEGNEGLVPCWLVPFRATYFSIITMTTLGFGDMYANAQSIWGHILLTFQVILGYVLLGALVTRFAVLFTAGGPAGKFADEKKDEKK
jgi:hypothetical protein